MKQTQTHRHPIQTHILNRLATQAIVRFRDLRPKHIDSNLFTYHLGVLVKQGLVVRSINGYSLGVSGLNMIDEITQPILYENNNPPTMHLGYVVQNTNGDILLSRRTMQPFIDTWGLPSALLTTNTTSFQQVASHVARSLFGINDASLEHAGDCYVTVHIDAIQLDSIFMHVFRMYSDDIILDDTLRWARPHKLKAFALSPGTEEIMTRTFFNDSFYFEEFEVTWYNTTYEYE